MLRLVLTVFLMVVAVAAGQAEEAGTNGTNGRGEAAGAAGPDEPEAKMVSGMSILGNKEAPMSLFIVPWKSSELGAETSLTRTLNEKDVPVDREVFLREVEFYNVSVGGQGNASSRTN